jgi:spore coat polysaccharide biosynthesis protein SpsF
MGATRLPGKVLKEVLGRPLLFYLIERLKQSKMIEQIVIATTTSRPDGAIYEYARSQGVAAFRGSESDVLDRYYQAARESGLDIVVRMTADCPLFDPEMTDEVIGYFIKHPEHDYVRTGPSYPEGFDTEVFGFKSLETAWREAVLRSEREHVTPFIWKNKERFKVKELALAEDHSNLRLSVDEEADFVVIKNILEYLYRAGSAFRFADILRLYRTRPEIFALNQHIARNEGYLKSLREDQVIKHG